MASHDLGSVNEVITDRAEEILKSMLQITIILEKILMELKDNKKK